MFVLYINFSVTGYIVNEFPKASVALYYIMFFFLKKKNFPSPSLGGQLVLSITGPVGIHKTIP
jgi:hypothetical protein